MDFLRKLFVQTQTHLKGLTLSQRLAIGSCVGLIVVSLLWLMDWAGEPTLVPLLDQPMSAQELAPIQQRLDSLQVNYKLAGSTLMVPAESRPRLLAQLGQAQALPKDISIGLSKLMEETNPFISMEDQAWRRSVGLSNELSRVLCEFDGVLSARVFIDKNTRRSIGGGAITPTASVFVKTAPGAPLTRERVFGIASFVSRAVAGLDISNVAITDANTGRSWSVPKVEDSMAFDDLEDRQKKEAYFADKVRELLSNIPGVLVAVHAELNPDYRRETKLVHGKPVTINDRTETTTQRRGVMAEDPGVVANTSRSVSTGQPTEIMEKSVSETISKGEVDVTTTSSETPRHGLKSLYASVNVPRSYLLGIFKGPDGKEPTDAELNTLSAEEIGKIKRQVMTALAVTDEKMVQVDWFHDGALPAAAADMVQAGAADGLVAMVKSNGSKVGLGALAAVSLFMMLMMVRKVGEGPVLPGEEPPSPLRRRNAENDEVPFSEANVTEQLLMAKEVDERTVRTQQVIEQIASMVKEDPASSVNILKQWIGADKQ